MRFLPFVSYAVLATAETYSFWRMELGEFTGAWAYQMDPIVSDNKISEHALAFHGSSGVGMTADFGALRAGQCTTAAVLQDMSSYW
jgi:hypothetical protein